MEGREGWRGDVLAMAVVEKNALNLSFVQGNFSPCLPPSP